MPRIHPSSLPFLGAGMGYRRAIAPFYRRHRPSFFEVMPEHLAFASPEAARSVQQDVAGTPVVTHSVSLNVGAAAGADMAWARRMAAWGRRLNASWATDHLCYIGAPGQAIGQLTPLAYTEELLEVVTRNVRAIQAALGVPFLLENISQYFAYPGAMGEPEFLHGLTSGTGCGILLDVTNVRNNAANLGWDAKRYLDAIPLESVVQMHIAGSERIGGKLLDTHGAPIHRESWRLARQVVASSRVRALLIERDQTFGPLPQLARELEQARTIMEAAR
ncbi:MAG: MbnB/TglH/ChrH family RiPP precursor modification enzyme [Thermoplasmatota archaeon]